jgi:hypothetical protein
VTFCRVDVATVNLVYRRSLGRERKFHDRQDSNRDLRGSETHDLGPCPRRETDCFPQIVEL